MAQEGVTMGRLTEWIGEGEDRCFASRSQKKEIWTRTKEKQPSRMRKESKWGAVFTLQIRKSKSLLIM